MICERRVDVKNKNKTIIENNDTTIFIVVQAQFVGNSLIHTEFQYMYSLHLSSDDLEPTEFLSVRKRIQQMFLYDSSFSLSKTLSRMPQSQSQK